MTTFADYARKGARERLLADPKLFMACVDKIKLIESGKWPKWLVDSIFQNSRFHNTDPVDSLVFLKTYTRILDGLISVFSIPVSSTPYPDKFIVENDSVLKTMPHPFLGEFWGGLDDFDGYIEWSKPIHSTVTVKKEFSTEPSHEIQWALIPEKHVELEVGTNSSVKFDLALNLYGGIARWPYGHKCIYVFLSNKSTNFLEPGDDEFEIELSKTQESIYDALYSLGRNPWEKLP